MRNRSCWRHRARACGKRSPTHRNSTRGWVKLAGTFAPGARLSGPVTHPGYEHVIMEVTVERMEPEHLFSWRWHPGADKAAEDEPATLVVFELEDADGGTLLTVVETGFDRLPVARRAKAYRENDDGWTGQMKAIRKHVAGT